MTDAEPKRSDDETRADEVRRRLVEAVREQFDEISRRTSDQDMSNDGPPAERD